MWISHHLRFLEHVVLEGYSLWQADDVHVDVLVVQEGAPVQHRAVRCAEHVLKVLQHFTVMIGDHDGIE